jgi:hypothetical protein
MTASTFAPGLATEPTPGVPRHVAGYRPGVCNIGPAEVARRRRAGDAALLATAVAFAVMVGVGAPPPARLLLALPAAGAASGYLQARLRFCAGFGSRGVFNFGPLGQANEVRDTKARARDRARSIQIGLASAGVGLAVGLAAMLLPI